MLKEDKKLGIIQSVDTSAVIIKIEDESILDALQVNQLLWIRSNNSGEKIIAIVHKIMRRMVDSAEEDSEEFSVDNIVKAYMIGTWFEKIGTETNVFKRSLETVPSIGCASFVLEENQLTEFMSSISSKDEKTNLEIGKYTIQKDAITYLDGDKFFQRHAVVVGSTGSGKSWTIATILEKSSNLQSVNNIVFDLHGEYQPLKGLDNTTSLKIAGPSDNQDDGNIIFLPYWLLSYEEIEAMILDRSDQNAPNQARALFDNIIKFKQEKLDKNDDEQKAILDNFTIDSPIPYDLKNVLEELERSNEEMVPGSGTRSKQGPLHGKLTRFIQRLKSKQSDKRLNFIFNKDENLQKYEWFENSISKLMSFEGDKKGSKIIDFSEVPSDILPLITGLLSRIIFSVQQWTDEESRHPIALFCDEAHLYIPQNVRSITEEKGLNNFERIAKEGRKYGISLVVISQRPADVSKTVLSQCGNFIAMRLTNPDDQNVIKRLFPDSLGGFADLLPILDIGEGLIVGDSCLLPSRVKINAPDKKPQSATVNFWQEWDSKKEKNSLSEAVKSLRKQSRS